MQVKWFNEGTAKLKYNFFFLEEIVASSECGIQLSGCMSVGACVSSFQIVLVPRSVSIPKTFESGHIFESGTLTNYRCYHL